jgi:hypothetical protein
MRSERKHGFLAKHIRVSVYIGSWKNPEDLEARALIPLLVAPRRHTELVVKPGGAKLKDFNTKP